LKKTNLIFISSIVLFSLISVSLAQAGCVVIKVQYQDSCPRSGADVKTIVAPNNPQVRYICTTGEDGQCSRCDYLEQGDYQIRAWYSGSQFGPNTYLGVNGSGDGNATIPNQNSPYPNGTEVCGDSECDGFQYCYNHTTPAYIECNSTNTDCDTKKCCNCTGGTKVQPTENYDPTQNSDCPATSCPDDCNIDANLFTWDYANDKPNYCSALDTCTNNQCDYGHNCADDKTADDIFLWDGIVRTCTAPCDQDSDCLSNICKPDCTCEPKTCGLSAGDINFGSVKTGEISLEKTVTLTNTGNSPTTSLTIKGIDWSGVGTMSVGQTHWFLTSGQPYSSMTPLTTSDVPLGQQVSPGSPLPVYFKLQIPGGQTQGSYSQTITFTASC
jgi:hypothetical protein